MFVIVGPFFAWLIVAHSLLPAIGTIAPRITLAVQPGDAAALLAYATQEFAEAGGRPPDTRPYAGLEARLNAGLAAEPLDASLFSLLGLVAEAKTDKARAGDLMRLAVTLSKRDAVAGIWLMRERFDAGDYAGACYYAGLLLRSGDPSLDIVAPVLTRMLETPAGFPHAERLVLDNPSWRPQYMDRMMSLVTDARTPLRLLMALKDAKADISRNTLRNYVSFLANLKRYDIAYYTWLQFLPAEQLESAGLLFNGRFAHALSGFVFDWKVASGAGYTADVAAAPGEGGDRALMLQFGEGRVEAIDVQQTTVLRPGAYVMRGRYLGTVTGPRGLQWTIRCRDTWADIADGPLVQGDFVNWRAFEWTFRIPEKDCPAQQLRLVVAARSASEQFLRGTIWFDDLSIRRAESALR